VILKKKGDSRILVRMWRARERRAKTRWSHCKFSR